MVGVIHVFIKNFAHLTHPLTALMCKDMLFVFGLEQISTQDMLKTVLLASPTLCPIDYASNSPVILGVDTSSIVVGYLLCQCDVDNLCIHCYTCFSSITLNDCESHFSQLKLELYGLFHALCLLKMYLIGIWNLIVEVDMQYIKGMLLNPVIAPLASVNCWIVSFSFTSLLSTFQEHSTDPTVSRNTPSNREMKTTIQSTIWSSMAGLIRYMASCIFLTLLIFRLLLLTKTWHSPLKP